MKKSFTACFALILIFAFLAGCTPAASSSSSLPEPGTSSLPVSSSLPDSSVVSSASTSQSDDDTWALFQTAWYYYDAESSNPTSFIILKFGFDLREEGSFDTQEGVLDTDFGYYFSGSYTQEGNTVYATVGNYPYTEDESAAPEPLISHLTFDWHWADDTHEALIFTLKSIDSEDEQFLSVYRPYLGQDLLFYSDIDDALGDAYPYSAFL